LRVGVIRRPSQKISGRITHGHRVAAGGCAVDARNGTGEDPRVTALQGFLAPCLEEDAGLGGSIAGARLGYGLRCARFILLFAALNAPAKILAALRWAMRG